MDQEMLEEETNEGAEESDTEEEEEEGGPDESFEEVDNFSDLSDDSMDDSDLKVLL